MLRPAVSQILKNQESYFSLVIGVAKRARIIADEIIENKEILEEKPVKTAVAQIASGQYKLVEDPSIIKRK